VQREGAQRRRAAVDLVPAARHPGRDRRHALAAVEAHVMRLLFPDKRHWHQVKRCDVRARELADRHYSRQTPGAAEFMANGRTLVLLTVDARAVWGVIENNDPHGGRHWRCSIFRNDALPSVALTTEIDATRTRPKLHPGRCFRAAGWTVVEVSTRSHRHKELVILRAPMERFA
jgi:hypothetical protein